jgi:hypothetical protein
MCLMLSVRPGTTNTRPARGFDAAPKHLVRARKHRKLGEKFIFFNLWYVNRLCSYFFFNFQMFYSDLKKSFQNSVNLWPLKQFYCIMRPPDSWSCLMRPASLFEFETPALDNSRPNIIVDFIDSFLFQNNIGQP